MRTNTHISPCPLCGSDAELAKLGRAGRGSRYEYVIRCVNCQYASDVVIGRQEAIDRHNKKAREEAVCRRYCHKCGGRDWLFDGV